MRYFNHENICELATHRDWSDQGVYWYLRALLNGRIIQMWALLWLLFVVKFPYQFFFVQSTEMIKSLFQTSLTLSVFSRSLAIYLSLYLSNSPSLTECRLICWISQSLSLSRSTSLHFSRQLSILQSLFSSLPRSIWVDLAFSLMSLFSWFSVTSLDSIRSHYLSYRPFHLVNSHLRYWSYLDPYHWISLELSRSLSTPLPSSHTWYNFLVLFLFLIFLVFSRHI